MENISINTKICKKIKIKPLYVIKTPEHQVLTFNSHEKKKAKYQLESLGYVNQNIDDYFIFPNLKNPNNFISLFELPLFNGDYTLGKIVNSKTINQNRKEFLTTLSKILDKDFLPGGNFIKLSDEELSNIIEEVSKIKWMYL